MKTQWVLNLTYIISTEVRFWRVKIRWFVLSSSIYQVMFELGWWEKKKEFCDWKTRRSDEKATFIHSLIIQKPWITKQKAKNSYE